ncbi:MAG: SGNH/GDSL hydrolase family protein [Nocardioidaceae bacterium]
MSKASAAKRLAAAAAVGGGGLSFFGGSVYAVLVAEARMARRRIGDATNDPPDPSGLYGALLPGPPLRLAVLGDSGAAGYGARIPQETFGAFLATGLSRLAGRPVRLTSVAVVGAKTADLAEQIPIALSRRPDVCSVIIGTNDVTHVVRPSQSVRSLREAVATLRAGGPEVVIGTCPDLGTLRPVAPPLRQLARLWSRRLAAAQTIAAVEAGARSVSLGTILGPEFSASPSQLFGPDQFHPSPAGYRRCAAVMLPTVASAVGVEPAGELAPEPARGEGLRSLAEAAADAADDTGAEVSHVDVPADVSGSRGRWVLLRHRRRQPIPTVEPVAVEDTDPDVTEPSADQVGVEN